MQLDTILKDTGRNGAFAEVGRAYGLDAAQTQTLVAAVLPELTRRIERNTLSRGGLADMVESLGNPMFQRALDNPALLKTPELQSAGIGLLDQILGSKDRSRAVAAHAAASTGLSEILIKQLLPIIASMIMGSLAKSGSGSLGDILSKIPGLPGGGGSTGGFPAPGQRPAAPMPTPQSSGGSPLPLPGSHTPLDQRQANNPYGDLSDMIRRGGGGGGIGTASGAPGIIRSILGSLLGFSGGGVMSWILRAVFMRYGWSIIRFIFGRLLLGR